MDYSVHNKSGAVFGFQVAAKSSRGWMFSSICDPCSPASLLWQVLESKTALFAISSYTEVLVPPQGFDEQGGEQKDSKARPD